MREDELSEAEKEVLAEAAQVHGDQWVFENEDVILAQARSVSKNPSSKIRQRN